jgi:hypothetical protein
LWRWYISIRNFAHNMTLKYYVFGQYPSSCFCLKTPSCLHFKTKCFGDTASPKWVSFTWKRRQNPVSETLCFEIQKRRVFSDKNRTIDNVQKHNILASCYVWNFFILFTHHNRKYGHTIHSSFLTTSLSAP